MSIFTIVLWVSPILMRSRETAMHFIPGFKVSPHAATEGEILSVCQKTELYAEAVTSCPNHSNRGGFASGFLEQAVARINMKSSFRNRPNVRFLKIHIPQNQLGSGT